MKNSEDKHLYSPIIKLRAVKGKLNPFDRHNVDEDKCDSEIIKIKEENEISLLREKKQEELMKYDKYQMSIRQCVPTEEQKKNI